MAELLDPTKIDEMVGSALGTKPAAKPSTRQQTSGPNLSGLDSALAQRLEEARAEYKRLYGKELPITSGVRTRAEQERLFKEAQGGKPGVYMPLNPADYPNRQTFHTEAVDISTDVPESFLNKFGIHRPLGKKDPVHAVLMPAPQSNTAAAPSGMMGMNEDLLKPENINAAVKEAVTTVPTKVKSKSGTFLSDVGASTASLADTALNAVTGTLDYLAYPLARAYYGTQMPPEQAAERARQETTSAKNIVGRTFGVEQTPEYQNEASRKIMEAAAQVPGWAEGKTGIPLTAKTISEKTGIPQADVESYLNTGLFAVPGLAKTKPGQAVTRAVGEEVGVAGQALKQGAQKVTPAPVQRMVGNVVEAVAPGTTNMPAKTPVRTLGQPQVAPYAAEPAPGVVAAAAPRGRASIGAAGTPDATIIQQALTGATPEFQQLYSNMPLDKVNTPVVLRHLEGDSLPVPVRLTEGQATGDLVKISNEQNLRGRNPEFAYRFQQQNQALVDNVPAIRERAAPDVYAPKTIDSSQAIIDAYRTLDSERSGAISAAYKALEDANGGSFPVDGAAIARTADTMLAKKLKTEFLSPSIRSQLERFKAGEPMTFEQFEAMRTNLAAEIRKAERTGDGNAATAASIVRDAMEQLPIQGQAAALKPLADKARSLARERFEALRKDPAYKAAVDETVPADKYFDKYVIGGHNKNINTMIQTLGRDSPAHQHIKAGTINWLSDRAGIVDGKGNFSQANYNKAIKRLDDVNNFGAIFDPETSLQLKTLGNVANYTQFQPRGAFVNNSNTLVGYLANKAAGGLETAGNVIGLKTIGYPLGSEGRRVIQGARERAEVKRALEPGAGSTLQDISKKGQQ
jgi:hypothetical protein